MNYCTKMVQRCILLMSSSRVHGYEYLEHAKDQLTEFLNARKVKTVLFVPYALGDYDKYTDTVRQALAPLGYNVVGLHDKSDEVEALQTAEAIFVGGGNTFVLLKKLYDKELVSVLRDVVLNKGVPYIGSSAGTNVATPSIHTTNDMPVAYPPTFDALKLVPFNINPHYLETEKNTKHKGETRDERLLEFLKYHQRPVVGLREGSSILVDGDNVTLIGDKPAKIFKPNETPLEVQPNSSLGFLL